MSAHVSALDESSSRTRVSAWAFAAAIVVTGVACWIAVELAPLDFRTAMAWFGSVFAVLLSVATAIAVSGQLETRALRSDVTMAQEDADIQVRQAVEQAQAQAARYAQQAADAQAAASAQVRAVREQAQGEASRHVQELGEVRAGAVADVHAVRQETGAEATRIVDHVIPELLSRLGGGASAPTALAEVAQPATDWGVAVLRVLAEHLGRVERAKAAALAACASAAGRMQAQSTSMAAELRDMEDSADSATLARLLEVDHYNAQLGRLADSIAVLTGARSGRRWARPISMESILRGAMSRISDYRRVQLHAPVEVAVVGYAAEGVIHLLAELIDNAAQFSPPTEQVHVYVEEAHAGVVVAIEDSGVGMMPRALARAEAAISAPAGDLSSVSGTRLGLAVVGQLARKYGLQVSYRPSARGGVGVVVMIPRQLITEEPRLNPTLPARRGELVGAGVAGRHASPAPAEIEAPVDPDPEQPFELARRQPGQTLAAQAARAQLPPPPRPRTDPGAAFGAFQRAKAAIRHGELTDDEPAADATASPDDGEPDTSAAQQ
jgi:signal transduction histidine kinase